MGHEFARPGISGCVYSLRAREVAANITPLYLISYCSLLTSYFSLLTYQLSPLTSDSPTCSSGIPRPCKQGTNPIRILFYYVASTRKAPYKRDGRMLRSEIK
jgi:hypothetical protein